MPVTYPESIINKASDAPFSSDRPQISVLNDIPSAYLDAISEFAYGLQLENFFTLTFDPGLPSILTDENNWLNIDQRIKGTSSKQIVDIVQSEGLFKRFGVLFVRGLSIPGYNSNYEMAGSQYRDFKAVPAMGAVAADNRITTQIIDTHISFVDFIIRPWVILNTHYGFVERNPADPQGSLINGLRLNSMTLTQYARTGAYVNRAGNQDVIISASDLQIIKRISLYKCTPVNAPGFDVRQDSNPNSAKNRDVDWVFQDIEIDIPG
jgi:hypothetical protein